MELLINLLYIVSAFLFIFGIKRLGNAAHARRGNRLSSLGMLLAVIATLLSGGFGAAGGKHAAATGEIKAESVQEAYYVLEAARSGVIIPGYGMAVAQAQHAVKDLSTALANNGTEVRFAIHPVAGRMPGHMNALLAEADVPYGQLQEMETVNAIMPAVDVAIVIGANDAGESGHCGIPVPSTTKLLWWRRMKCDFEGCQAAHSSPFIRQSCETPPRPSGGARLPPTVSQAAGKLRVLTT